MTDEEIKKYLQWMNKEYGQRGYSAGKGPPDMYGRQTTTGKEGWSDLLREKNKNSFVEPARRGSAIREQQLNSNTM